MTSVRVGHRYKHIKRGTTYKIVGVILGFHLRLKDGDTAYLVNSQELFEGHHFELTTNLSDVYAPDDITFCLPVTVQKSNTYSKDRPVTTFAIYQGEADGKFWVRPTGEFTKDRFERIKE